MGKIADISHHQGDIDWSKAHKELDLVIIRTSYSTTIIDRKYKEYVAGAKKYGVPFGHYHYAMFRNTPTALAEAKRFVELADPEAKFLVIDVEDAKQVHPHLVLNVQIFVDYVRKHTGKKVGLYSGQAYYKANNLSKVDCDFLWIARYGNNDSVAELTERPEMACDLWQFTSRGSLAGVSGNVDLNLLGGTKDLKWFIGEEEKKETVKPSTPSKVSSKPSVVKKEKLVEDGYWGPATTKALQRHYGTTVDGIISGQPKNATTKNIPSVHFGTGGSQLIRAMQKDLGTTVDGVISCPSQMIKALQKRLGTTQDGKVSYPSNVVKIMQKALNNSTF